MRREGRLVPQVPDQGSFGQLSLRARAGGKLSVEWHFRHFRHCHPSRRCESIDGTAGRRSQRTSSGTISATSARPPVRTEAATSSPSASRTAHPCAHRSERQVGNVTPMPRFRLDERGLRLPRSSRAVSSWRATQTAGRMVQWSATHSNRSSGSRACTAKRSAPALPHAVAGPTDRCARRVRAKGPWRDFSPWSH